MQVSYGRHDHRQRHRYCSRLCARQHRPDHRVPVSRVRDRMVHRSAARAPSQTARRRVTYRGGADRVLDVVVPEVALEGAPDVRVNTLFVCNVEKFETVPRAEEAVPATDFISAERKLTEV